MSGKKTLGASEKVRRKEVLKLKKVFETQDKDGSREILFNELLSTLEDTEVERAKSMFAVMDRNSDQKITFEEFINFHFPRTTRAEREKLLLWAYPAEEVVEKQNVISEEQQEEMKNIFLLYDSNGDGTLDISELVDALSASGYDESELQVLFENIDRDGSGTLNFDEFSVMLAEMC
mmetsp:Transcript_32256/g.70373  ORF Transcript_32256/g.70373 Transcript_32256/m.70373 type:complete len:177 (-) Transcript_32256:159-689(-)|eukprot:CAMPEP_0118940786 /NCGR_PEP_ID=MMETSP1169-20130426/32305_1 /TAXON_ID=36882 /ORGANISM="Pyramimonas obovata, Strain CCMP722" /LENGTH=176 /DNA_ID=CAMNT_0006885373 /DNA_START=374 /DNA_END=904 /DNA_ORIENTATION=+